MGYCDLLSSLVREQGSSMPEVRGSNILLQEQQDSLSKVHNISLNHALDTRCEFSCPNFPSVKTVEDYQTAVTWDYGGCMVYCARPTHTFC